MELQKGVLEQILKFSRAKALLREDCAQPYLGYARDFFDFKILAADFWQFIPTRKGVDSRANCMVAIFKSAHCLPLIFIYLTKIKFVFQLEITQYTDVRPMSLSMLWQIPQYLTLTSGEVLFSITGLEFAYSQAPISMKSCIMAGWLLTVSIGNAIVVIFAEARVTENMVRTLCLSVCPSVPFCVLA